MASLLKVAKEMGVEVITESDELERINELMALPGPKVSKKMIEAWLEPRDDEERYTIDEAFEIAKKEVIKSRKLR